MLARRVFSGLALLKVGAHAVFSSVTGGRLEYRQHVALE